MLYEVITPCQLKKTVSVDIPRPRSYETQSSEEFRLLMEEVNEAVHEEAPSHRLDRNNFV